MSAIQDDDLDVQTGLERSTESRARVVSPRDLAMQEMERNRIAEFNQETGLNVPFVPDPDLVTDPDADPDDAEAERARQQLEADGKLKTAPPVDDDDQVTQQVEDLIADPRGKKVRTKVNGIEQDVDLETVLRTFQKDTAADVRLQEASETLRRAREEAERIRAEAAAQPAKPNTPPPEVGAVAKEITAAFFSGDEDKATELLTQALSGAPSQGTRTADLDVGTVAQAVRQQLKEETALSEFAESYPKLVESPRLATLADIEIDALMKQGKSKADAILEAGRTLYAEFGFETPVKGRTKQPDTSTGDMSERLARKRAATAQVVSARSVAAPGNTEVEMDEAAARSAAIAEVARARPGHIG